MLRVLQDGFQVRLKAVSNVSDWSFPKPPLVLLLTFSQPLPADVVCTAIGDNWEGDGSFCPSALP